MNIVQINTTYGDADSTGRTTKEMHQWLCMHGIESYCFVARINDATEQSNRIRLFGATTSEKAHSLLSRVTGLQGYYSLADTKRLAEQILKIEPDIVILRVLHSNCVNFSVLFEWLRNKGCAVIVVLHDCFFFTGHCTHFYKYKCDKWKNECGHCPGIRQDNVSWFFDTSGKCLRDKARWFGSIDRLGIVGVSDWITDMSKKSILGKAGRIRRIYNWIDIDAFSIKDRGSIRNKYGFSSEDIVLLGVASNWTDDKGLQIVIDTAREIKNAQIVLVGKVPKRINLADNVKCVGRIDDIYTLAEHYAMADVFLNPSVQETFGKTTAEALSCGIPVVAFDTTANAELVGNDRGRLAKVNDALDFVNAVKNVLENGSEYYTKTARAFAAENFSIDKSMTAYMKLFGEMIA